MKNTPLPQGKDPTRDRNIKMLLKSPIKVILVFLVAALLIACGGAPVEASNPEEEVLPTPTEFPTPIPKPTRSVQEVVAVWGNPEHLDHQHLTVSSRCSECHKPPYVDKFSKASCPACHREKPYSDPPDEVCMECHGGSYSGVTELTSNYTPSNPHDYHYTNEVGCGFCHKMHKPRVSSCGLCHQDFKLSKVSE
jgi:hypothetical protein